MNMSGDELLQTTQISTLGQTRARFYDSRNCYDSNNNQHFSCVL